MATVLRRVRIVLEMIRFSHTVFALPFALIGMLLAARGWPRPWTLAWIVAACFFARSAAMAFNRLADHQLDAKNPRTAKRALPAGLLTRRFVWLFVAVCIAGFVFSAAMLNPLCLALSPVALAVLLGYSYTKRFTNYSHLALGLALGIAPMGAWIAVRGDFGLAPALLCMGVLLWVAGFDVIYACQDYDFDRQSGLHSLPKRLGIGGGLWVARLFHAGALALFLAVYFAGHLGWFYLSGVCASGALMIYEHSLVREDDLTRVNMAFFTVNGAISIGLFVAATLDFALGWAGG